MEDVNEIRRRWLTRSGTRLALLVVSSMARGRSIGQISGVSTLNGRLDLRGFPFEPAKLTGRSFPFRRYVVEFIRGGTRFSRVSFKDIDLSFAAMNSVIWDRCRFVNVSFDNTDWADSGFWACDLANVSFDSARLRGTTLGGNLGTNACSYFDCSFNGADLRDTGHTFTAYKDCSFIETNLKDVDFDGARFDGAVFQGTLDDTAFRLHARRATPGLCPRRMLDTRQFVNEMIGIDFAKATLRYVNFDGVDLSRCIFPSDGKHLVIRNQQSVFQSARNTIEREWLGSDRQTALDDLDGMYLSVQKLHGMLVTENKLKQPIAVINLDDYMESYGLRLGARIFALIKQVDSEQNRSD